MSQKYYAEMVVEHFTLRWKMRDSTLIPIKIPILSSAPINLDQRCIGNKKGLGLGLDLGLGLGLRIAWGLVLGF